jgi:curved DNA-binding protein
LLGENVSARDNLSLGKFIFGNIAPAPKSVPQIELQFSVSQGLELNCVAVDIASGQIKNYEPIYLNNLTPPPIKEPLRQSGKSSFKGEFDNSGISSDFFRTVFGESASHARSDGNAQDYSDNPSLRLSFEEAGLGTLRSVQVRSKRLKVQIPAGVQTGTRVRLSNIVFDDGTKEDVYIAIVVDSHPFFQRENLDLYMTYPISKRLALHGGSVSIPMLEKGKSIVMEIPPKTKNEQVFRLKGKGIAAPEDPRKIGDFYVKIDLYDPRTMSQSQMKVLKEISEHMK